jgi:hypothetical protein
MWLRSFRCASQHTHPAARSPSTIPTNPALPATSLIRLRPKRVSNRSVSRRGPSLFRALRMLPIIGRTQGSLLSAVNSLAGSIISLRSLISKTISASRSSPFPGSLSARRNAIARMCFMQHFKGADLYEIQSTCIHVCGSPLCFAGSPGCDRRRLLWESCLLRQRWLLQITDNGYAPTLFLQN